MALNVLCIGHLLYDIRCYVNDFPLPDKPAVIMGRLRFGAGDVFNAGFLTAFLEGKSLQDALIYGVGCSAIKCTREGAQFSPGRLELEKFLEENKSDVRLRKLSS